MFKNRFISLFVAISLLAGTVLLVREANAPGSYTVWAKAAEAEASTMDSATRSYIAWGQAMQVRNAIDSATRSYIARGEALEKAKLNAVDSATRSYIARGEALEAAERLGESGACLTTSLEDIFAGIPNNLDSATRSYIARGLALQAKNAFGALCS
jgi:hypothetical protein